MRNTSMLVHSRDMVCQKARRKGMTVPGGRMNRREEREVASCCWGRGRSHIHMQ